MAVKFQAGAGFICDYTGVDSNFCKFHQESLVASQILLRRERERENLAAETLSHSHSGTP